MLNTTFVVVQKKGCVTIPWHLRTEVGIDIGDMLEVSVEKGKIVFVPKKKSGAKRARTRLVGDQQKKKGRKK